MANLHQFAAIDLELEQKLRRVKGGMTLRLDHVLVERDSSKPLEQRTTSRSRIARQLMTDAGGAVSPVVGASTEQKEEKIAEAVKAELVV